MDVEEWPQAQVKSEDLKVGLISWAGSYLSYEANKSRIHATAKGLGRRQVSKAPLEPVSQSLCVCMWGWFGGTLSLPNSLPSPAIAKGFASPILVSRLP